MRFEGLQACTKCRWQHNIIQPCGPVPCLWHKSIIFCEPLEQTRNNHLLSTHVISNLEIWVKLYSPDILCRNYHSFQEYLHGTLFIRILFLIIIINSNTIIENTDIIHNIQAGTIYYSYWRTCKVNNKSGMPFHCAILLYCKGSRLNSIQNHFEIVEPSNMFEPNIVTLVHELAHVGGPSKPIFFGSTSLDISLSSFWGQPKKHLNIAQDNVLFRELPSKYFTFGVACECFRVAPIFI